MLLPELESNDREAKNVSLLLLIHISLILFIPIINARLLLFISQTLLPIILGHTPAGASTKQVMHYVQLINTGKHIRVLICIHRLYFADLECDNSKDILLFQDSLSCRENLGNTITTYLGI